MPRKNKRKPVSIDQLNLAIQRMIEGKTHREIAILGGALLEGMLFDLLKETLVDTPFQEAGPLFDYPKPLSSFGNMLSLAYAFGVISDTEYSTVNVIKKIRNHAAHSIGLGDDDEFNFAKEPVRSMLLEFYPKHAVAAAPKDFQDQVKKDFDRMMDADPKLAYRMVFCLAEVSLMGRQALSERFAPPPEINEGVENIEMEDRV